MNTKSILIAVMLLSLNNGLLKAQNSSDEFSIKEIASIHKNGNNIFNGTFSPDNNYFAYYNYKDDYSPNDGYQFFLINLKEQMERELYVRGKKVQSHKFLICFTKDSKYLIKISPSLSLNVYEVGGSSKPYYSEQLYSDRNNLNGVNYLFFLKGVEFDKATNRLYADEVVVIEQDDDQDIRFKHSESKVNISKFVKNSYTNNSELKGEVMCFNHEYILVEPLLGKKKKIFNLKMNQLTDVKAPGTAYDDFALIEDKAYIFDTGKKVGYIDLNNLDYNEPIKTRKLGEKSISSNNILAAGMYKYIDFYDLTTTELLYSYKTNTNASKIIFSPDGTVMVAQLAKSGASKKMELRFSKINFNKN